MDSVPDQKYSEFFPSLFHRERFFTGWIKRVYQQKRFLYPNSTNDALNYWRERIIFAMLASGTGFSLLALVPSIYLALGRKLWILLIADSVAFLLLISMLVSRRVRLQAQAIVPVLLAFIIGVVVIWQVGFLSGGPAWLFTFSVLAGVLLGLRAALAATLLNGVAIILLAWLASPGHPAEQEFLRSFNQSIAAGANFIFLNAVVAVSVAVLVNGLQALNRKTAAATAALREEKAALLRTREKLTMEIVERKRTALELERARDAAEVANRAKSEFLANMSHELRTPLNHIIGFTELVVSKNLGELNPKQEEFLNDSLQGGHALLNLINQILDLSKMEAGRMTLSLSTVFLGPLMDDSLLMLEEKATKCRLNLITDIPDQPESFPADEPKLKQILNHLLSNAIKFTPEGGDIRVLVASDNESLPAGKGLRFSIIDSGIGLEPGDLHRIFQPFEQADSSPSKDFQGTGMGLALAKKMVELHGGKIWAASEGKGKGSAFHFVLPLPEADPAVQAGKNLQT